MRVGATGGDLQRLLEDRCFKVQKLAGEGDESFSPYVLRSIDVSSHRARLKKSCRRGRLETKGAEGTNEGHAVDGRSRL